MDKPPMNPYASPSLESLQAGANYVPEGGRLATRGERFAGAFIDGLIVLPFAFGGGVLLGLGLLASGIAPDSILFQIFSWLLGTIIGGTIYLTFHGYLLATRGQTIGKLLLKTRIVNEDGTHPDFLSLVLKRYAWLWFVASMPYVGGFLSLINALMIFRSNCKCLHDDIAGTKVIKLN
jgi:uncharacterized RDD family membrane protein YckC